MKAVATFINKLMEWFSRAAWTSAVNSELPLRNECKQIPFLMGLDYPFRFHSSHGRSFKIASFKIGKIENCWWCLELI